MAAFFSSLGKTIVAGIILLAVIFGIFGDAGAKLGDHAWWAFVMRWLHVLSGVMWIGLLWYFNFVQTPSMPKIPDEQKPAVSKVIAPRALFWFRYAALATVITGLLVAWMQGYIVQALTLQNGVVAIGLGMLRDAIRQDPSFPDQTRLELEHLVLSHHGEREHGSPVLPMTIEAFLFSVVDDLDAKMFQLRKHIAGDNSDGPFTGFSKRLDRVAFKPTQS